MAVNHGNLVTHIPQSLPSFAQAFSPQSLGNISSGNNSLPPIQKRLPPIEHSRVDTPPTRSANDVSSTPRTTSKKRPRNDVTSNTRDDEHSNSDGSPRLVHIKEEDHDMLDPSPPPPSTNPSGQTLAEDTEGAPPPSSLRPTPLKKRRVTISGAPHPLNTDVRVPVDQTNSTPISPVVMGFTIKRDNPSAIEQVRSMITVKQKQKALIEQRRGSAAGVMSPSTVSTNPIPPGPAEERSFTPSKPPTSTRPLRRSPNMAVGARRLTNNPNLGGANPRPPSPSPLIVPSQQPLVIPAHTTNANSLPPPPISFAKRRAEQLGSGKKKPADILISPREGQTQEQFQPAIQSAPPVQSSFFSGRSSMALPRLPSVIVGGDNVRRVASNVPPTPTRLSMHRNVSNMVVPQTVAAISARSPPAASVPIASTLVPPTPSTFHHPGYSGDKSAFLAPFEVFYDALNDSKQLKTWLGDQLQRSNALIQTLTQQQDKLNELVESLVEKRMAGIRSEVVGLHHRVEELEEALRIATSGRRHSTDITGGAKHKARTPLRNGVTVGPMAPETYTFPPASSMESLRRRPESDRKPSSPGRGQDREPRDNMNVSDLENGSPAPLDSTRISVSASRLEPPRSQRLASPQPRASFGMQSPPQCARDTPNYNSLPSSTPGRSSQDSGRDRPILSRQHSAQGSIPSEQQIMTSPPIRRNSSRSNSVIMSPPEAPGDDT